MLRTITVSDANEDLCAVDNIVYNKDKTEFITIAHGSTPEIVKIPESVKSIREFAFSGNTALTEVVLNENITDIGEAAFANCENLRKITLPSSLKLIGEYVFSNCKALSTITIPSGVKTVSYCAFSYCTGLTEVVLEEGVEKVDSGAFFNCSSLKRITFPQSLKSLNCGFSGCSSLEELELPQNLTSMKVEFSYCSSLKTIELPDCVSHFYDGAFMGCESLTSITVPEKVTEIPNAAFSGCTSLKTIILSDNVKKIGDNVFSKCTALENFHIGKSVTNLELRTLIPEGSNVYSYSPDYLQKLADCINLKDITVSAENPDFSAVDGNLYNKDKTILYKYAIGKTDTSFTVPSYVVRIEQYAFEDAVNLTTILIPEKLDIINKNSFEGCTNLVYNTLNGASYLGNATSKYAALMSLENVSTITEYTIASGTTVVAGEIFSGANNLVTLNVPKTLKGVGNNAFRYCNALTTINIEDIGAWAMINFANIYANPLQNGKAILYVDSKAITDVVIPEGVTEIGSFAFVYYENMTSIQFPSTLKAIKNNSFCYCTGLKDIVLNEGLETIGYRAFAYCSALESITFPKSLKTTDSGILANCSNFKIINITDVAAWCSVDFPNDIIYTNYDLYVNNKPAETLVIPSDVKKVNDYAFNRAKNIRNIVISEGVEEVGKRAFWDNVSLESVTIPESLKELDDGAFADNSLLKNVYISDLQAWCNIHYTSTWSDFYKANPLYNGANLYLNGKLVENITIDFEISRSNPSFAGCKGLKSVVFSGNANMIGKSMFLECSNLTSVTVNSDKIETINYNSFSGCKALTKVVLGEGVKEISNSAFLNCTNLAELTIPSTLEKIGYRAFYGANKIAKLDIADVAAYNAIEFYNDTYSYPVRKEAKLYIKGKEAKELIFPEGTQRINSSCFYRFSNIEYLSIPESLKYISSGAFMFCTGLKKVTLLNENTSIASNAFYNCNNIQTVEFAGTEARLKEISSVLYNASEKIYLRKVEIYDADNSYKKYFVLLGEVFDFEDSGYVREGLETNVYGDSEHMYKADKNAPITEHSVFYVAYELGKDIVISISRNSFTVTPVNYKTDVDVIFALYRNDRLTDTQKKVYTGEDVIFNSDAEYDTVTIMIWNSLEGMNPVDEAKIVKASTDTDYKNGKFTVTMDCFNGECDVILALYNGDMLVDEQMDTYSGSDVIFTTDKAFTTAKVFAWDDPMQPVTSAENVKLS
ncbi:MAG: leucine-rich repeat domain-containing protein [Eubacteriales bacterium]|nr:leucine-rich repeat domain-containing protein [Eubacteriales bacterium]